MLYSAFRSKVVQNLLDKIPRLIELFQVLASSYDNVTDRKNKHFDIGQAQVVQGARRRVDLPGLRKVVVCLLRLSSFLPPPPGCSGASCILKAKA